jgi:hypothetical protein
VFAEQIAAAVHRAKPEQHGELASPGTAVGPVEGDAVERLGSWFVAIDREHKRQGQLG